MPGNLTFAFGTNARFNLPVSTLQINYTIANQEMCGIAIQSLPNMQYQFDITSERHFYFGDVFFKQFVGIFDIGNSLLGMAKSSRATTDMVTFECAGDSCDELAQEEVMPTPDAPEPVIAPPDPTPVPTPDPTPTPTPDPEPTPSDDNGSGDSDMMWIWIIVGMGILFLIAVFIAIYYCQQSKKKDKWAAMQYANQTGNDGDLIEKDIEKYSGKGDTRTNQFADHDDLMKSSAEVVEDEPIPSPYALQ